jgi:hypothetical protein
MLVGERDEIELEELDRVLRPGQDSTLERLLRHGVEVRNRYKISVKTGI